MLTFELSPGVTEEHLGLIPSFFSESDPSSAAQQIDRNYQHGGGWRPMGRGGKNLWYRSEAGLKYPDDEPLKLLAKAKLRDEVIEVYEYAFVCILQPDGTFQVARVD